MGNFTVSSFPGRGTWLIGVFAAVVMGLALWHLARALRGARHAA